jgi:ribose/xylose/arabinose/galactoside ABC-type transport system permease subunit
MTTPWLKRLAGTNTLWIALVLLLLVAVFGALRPDAVLTVFTLQTTLVETAVLLVLAVGMTFVIITGGIDLSVGSVVALSGVLAAKLLATGWSPVPVMVLVLLIGGALGLVMGLVIHHLELQPFVVTLAGMFLARGLCYVISVESIPIRDPLFTAVAQGTVPLPGDTYVSPSVVVAVLVVLVGAYLLHATRFGRTVYAIGGNQHSAVLMGLRVGRTKVAVYALSGLCSAISGLLFAFYSLSGYSLSAVGTELDAIAATVIGGTLLSGGVGLIVGSLLGVLVLGLIQTFISFEGTLSSWWTRIVIGALLLVFVVLQRFLVRRTT